MKIDALVGCSKAELPEKVFPGSFRRGKRMPLAQVHD